MSQNKDVSLRDVQAIVDAWVGQWDEGYWHPLANLARLTEEVGELAREINHVHGPKAKKRDEPNKGIDEELGDLVFIVATLANSMGVDLDEAFRATIEKYNIRDADRWTKKVEP